MEIAKENYRDQRGLPQIDRLCQDVRHAVRQFGRNPGFTAVVVLTLTLGIGANTAIFSAVSAVMLRLLPVHDPDRLVYLNTTESINSQSGDGNTSLTEYIFEQMRARRDVFSDVVGFAPLSFQKVAVRYGREPEEAWVEMVSGNFFSGLGVPALNGRTFQWEDERTHAPVAVLSYDYWRRRTGGDPAAVGHMLDIKRMPFTVVGVAMRRFTGVDHGRPSDVWTPLQANSNFQPWDQAPGTGLNLYGSAHDWWCLKAIGRLQRGIGEAQAVAPVQPDFQRAAVEGVHVRRFGDFAEGGRREPDVRGKLHAARQAFRPPDDPPCTIVGVVKESKYTGVQEEAKPMAWFPYTQLPGLARLEVELHTPGNPDALLPELRQALLRFAPEPPLLQPMTQQKQFDRSFSRSGWWRDSRFSSD